MTMTNNNDLAPANNVLPAYLQELSAQGIGVPEVDINRLKIPMIKMVQLMSKQFDQKRANAWNFYNSITNEEFGREINFVILKNNVTWLKFSKERKLIGFSTNDITWQSGQDAGIELTKEEKYKCQHFNFYVLIVGKDGKVEPLPYCLSLSGMSAKAGDKLYNAISINAISKKLPTFSHVYTAKTIEKDSDQGKYSEVIIDVLPGFAPASVVKTSVEMLKVIDKKDIVIDSDEGEVSAQAASNTTVNNAASPQKNPEPQW